MPTQWDLPFTPRRIPKRVERISRGHCQTTARRGPFGGSRRGDAFKGLKYVKSNEFLPWPCQNCVLVMGQMAAAAREGFLVAARVGWVLGGRHAKGAW